MNTKGSLIIYAVYGACMVRNAKLYMHNFSVLFGHRSDGEMSAKTNSVKKTNGGCKSDSLPGGSAIKNSP